MSVYSGKSVDLADHIAGKGGWFDKDGNPVKFGQEGVGCYYSDELLDFEAFKKETGGVIHQHYKIKVDEYNKEFVKEHCKEFDFEERERYVADKRQNSGFRKEKYFAYIYYDRDYTAKELNKKGVYIEVDIHFDTLLDLIPYYPYLVAVSCGGYVVISNESYVDREYREHLEHGWISQIDYKKKLQEHYLEVCQKYFLKDLDKRTKIVSVKNLTYAPLMKDKESVEKHYFLTTSTNIDYMHHIEYVWEDGKVHSHWTSPKLVNDNTIELHKDDVEHYLKDDIKKGTVKIKYAEKMEFERYLD